MKKSPQRLLRSPPAGRLSIGALTSDRSRDLHQFLATVDADVVLIDCGAGESPPARFARDVADGVIIPLVVPSADTTHTMTDTDDRIDVAADGRPLNPLWRNDWLASMRRHHWTINPCRGTVENRRDVLWGTVARAVPDTTGQFALVVVHGDMPGNDPRREILSEIARSRGVAALLSVLRSLGMVARLDPLVVGVSRHEVVSATVSSALWPAVCVLPLWGKGSGVYGGLCACYSGYAHGLWPRGVGGLVGALGAGTSHADDRGGCGRRGVQVLWRDRQVRRRAGG